LIAFPVAAALPWLIRPRSLAPMRKRRASRAVCHAARCTAAARQGAASRLSEGGSSRQIGTPQPEGKA